MTKFVTFFCVFYAVSCTNSLNLSDLKELIVGGELTKIEEVPYQAALYFHELYFCSGSIVTPTQIITAAHCLAYVEKPSSVLTVRVGSARIHSGGQVAKVKGITFHPKFTRSAIDYDVAVVEVKNPLKFTSVVQPVALGEKEPTSGQEVRVSGWGFMKEIGPPSRKLRSVVVRMIDRKMCARNYKDHLVVTSRMICASAEGKDSCYGDSGGPLVHKGRLIGVVSTGEGCAREDFPGIYTNIANTEIRKFLRKEIASNAQ